MNPELKSAIDKLKIVRKLAQAPETQQVCDIIVELFVSLDEKDQLGFKINESRRNAKSKE